MLIGREKEQALLRELLQSRQSEFVALYGRRRVGKTYLVRETFNYQFAFQHTGILDASMTEQLSEFRESLYAAGLPKSPKPKTWGDAFRLLQRLLTSLPEGKKVVFIDELPWMDTPRSGFLTALESFWNGWACSRHNLCLVVCGSATSWMLDNIINNKGGLYGRLTCEMKLSPFTLLECEQFFKSRKIDLSRYNIIQAYMILGGIPFYLDCFNPSLSLAQNIDTLFFNPKAKLGDEFERLFNSVFDNAEDCMKIIRFLSMRHAGYRRDEIARKTDINPNGDFTKMLKALIASDFVTKYVPYGSANNEEYYKLTDCFCWFWLHFKEGKAVTERDYWMNHMKESEITSWRGIAFEEVCLQHILQIKMALQIAGVTSHESSLVVSGDDDTEGMQIDLLIDRADDVVNVCEMKYSKSNYAITKSYAEKLQKRLDALEHVQSDKKFHLTFVTVNPIERNIHSDIVKSTVTAEELFK